MPTVITQNELLDAVAEAKSYTPQRAPSRAYWNDDYEQFRKQLTNARKTAGLSQRDAARILGRAQSFVAKCESGRRRVDAVELARALTAYASFTKAMLNKR